MKQKDIIRMAREASASMLHGGEYALFGNTAIERFAALVAAAEREACAKVCENIYAGDEGAGDWPTPEMCAASIRARGQA